MKESKFNFWFQTKEGQSAIYNTFTQSLSILEKEDVYNIKNQVNDLEPYKKVGILVDDEIDELNIIKYDILRSNTYGASAFRILTTTGCNASCNYCYEKGIAITTMTEDTAHMVVSFIKAVADKDVGVRLEWFGGEPLLNYKVISIITNELIKENYNIVSAAITTNGILFTDELIINLKKDWKITNIQVTLDGIGEVYNNVKGIPYSFERVCGNIEKISKMGINVSVRMNIGEENLEDIEQLIEYLPIRFAECENIHFYLFPIFIEAEAASKDIMHHIMRLNKKMYDLGLVGENVYHFKYRSVGCVHATRRGYTIAPDGKIYNCSHTIRRNLSIGTLDKFTHYNTEKLKFMQLTIDSKCENCIFLPICGSGCRVGSLHQDMIYKCFIYKSVFADILNQSIEEGWAFN